MTDRAAVIAAHVERRRPWMGPRAAWWAVLRPVAECVRSVPESAPELLRLPRVRAALRASLAHHRRARRSWRRILTERRHLLAGLYTGPVALVVAEPGSREARGDELWRRYRLYLSLAATGHEGRPADQDALPDRLRMAWSAADMRERWRLALRGARLLRAHALLDTGGRGSMEGGA